LRPEYKCFLSNHFLTFHGTSSHEQKNPLRVAVTGAAGQIGCAAVSALLGEIAGPTGDFLQLPEVP
jgi:hypothetical protein